MKLIKNTFPRIRGTESIAIRLLNNCEVGTDSPTPM